MDEIKDIFDKAYDLCEKISKDLKELEDLIWKNYQFPIEAKIDFPQGILKRAEEKRTLLSFINSDVLKRNLSYHLMLADFYNWFLTRFDISLTGQEMLIKEAVCLYGNICAAIVKAVVGGKGVKPCISDLFENGVINEQLREDLEWLWDTRNKEHIENLKEWEYKKYTMDDYNRAVKVWDTLLGSLLEKYSKKTGDENGK